MAAPVSSFFWFVLEWVWRTGIVFTAMATTYVFRSAIIRALILPGSAPVAAKKMVLPAAAVQFIQLETSKMVRRGWHHEVGIVPSGSRGVALDVRTLQLNRSKEAFWVLFFLGNMGSVEASAGEMEDCARRLGANVVAFHYRGTTPFASANTEANAEDESPRAAVMSGPLVRQPVTAADLEEDGCAIVEHLRRVYGVDPSKRLVLYGHSIGGAVAAKVRCRFPGGILVCDRTFSRLAAVPIAPMHGKLPPRLWRVADAVLQFLVGTIGWSMDTLSLWYAISLSAKCPVLSSFLQ